MVACPLQRQFDDRYRRRQDTFSTALFSAYFSGDVKGIAEGHQTISRDGGFLPFKVSYIQFSEEF